MNILLTNAHSARNAGDHALLRSAIDLLKRHFPGCTITIALNDPASYEPRAGEEVVGSFLFWFIEGASGRWRTSEEFARGGVWLLRALAAARFGRRKASAAPQPATGRSTPFHALLDAYRRADLVVSCPGHIFMSGQGIGVPLHLALLCLGFAARVGKPYYILPQSIGPIRRRERGAVRRVLNRARLVELRDEPSREIVAGLKLAHDRVRVLPDVALGYHGESDLSQWARILAGKIPERPLLGVTVINWAGHDRVSGDSPAYEQEIATAVALFLKKHGGTAVFFPQVIGPSQREDDRPPAFRIAERLSAEGLHAIALDVAWTPDQLQAAYGQMDLFLGTRLHSVILALSARTPSYAIAYRHKTQGIMAMLGLEEWVNNIRTLDGKELAERLDALWQQRHEVAAQATAAIAALQPGIEEAGRLIAEDFETYGAAARSLSGQ